MSQISPPLRIALIAAIAFLGVWAMFLRPSAEEAVPVDPAAQTSAPAGQSVAGDAVAGANLSAENADAQAAAAADGTAATAPSATASTPATATADPAADPAAPAPAEPNAEALAKLPRDVARAVRRDKVVALLFWNPRAADDRRVRRSLSELGSYDGKVFVKAARVGEISRYAPITRGAEVNQAPTLVVVDADLRAESLVGFVARGTIRQALSDAVRASR